jgi:hypothetical protein
MQRYSETLYDYGDMIDGDDLKRVATAVKAGEIMFWMISRGRSVETFGGLQWVIRQDIFLSEESAKRNAKYRGLNETGIQEISGDMTFERWVKEW